MAKNITLSESGGRWYASIQTERDLPQRVPIATTAIGIDVGSARFATLSDGSFIAPLNSFKQHQLRHARYQRRMARKVRFTSNWKKEKAKVQKIHIAIANARKDFLQSAKTTRSFVLRIYRSGICPGQRRATANGTASGCGKRPV